jgi:hypothetical protein
MYSELFYEHKNRLPILRVSVTCLRQEAFSISLILEDVVTRYVEYNPAVTQAAGRRKSGAQDSSVLSGRSI